MSSDHPDMDSQHSSERDKAPSSLPEGSPAAVPSGLRLPPERRALVAAGTAAAALALAFAVTARSPQRVAVSPPKVKPRPTAVVQPVAVRSDPASVSEEREALVESVIRSQKKRIMGRKRSLPDIARIVTQISPLVARALEQPSIQDDLRLLAEQEGMSVAEYKRYFQRIQEADLLLESGGDPNARSPSDAIGVAQFLAGTARGSGNLKVNVPESRRLTWRIARLQYEITALQARPENWSKPLPGSRPAGVLMASAPPAARQKAADRGPARTSLTSRSSAAERAPAAPAAPPPVQPAATPPSEAATAPSATAEPGATQTAASAPGGGEKAEPAIENPATAPPAEPAPAEPQPAVTEPPQVQPENTRPAPASAAKPAVITRDELIQKRVVELRLLQTKRRVVDERYDPAKAIAAQTRYLVRMARRYGSLDWVFQAYHGGEGGVRNTVSYYLGSRWEQFASAEQAIRGVMASRGVSMRVRAPLSFEDLYFRTTPLTHPAAFSYVYGRSDNHRYYWWKILAAERAIALYRQDKEEFYRQWRALRPGQRLEVVWYPDSKELNFHDVADLKRGYAAGELVRWPASARNRGLVTGDVAPLDPANAYQYKGLRPEALGALYRIAAIYLANGGSKAPLRIHSLVQPESYRAKLNAARPPSWMRYRKPADEIPIDLQPTGLCLDIERPTADWNRKVLEYALGYLADRNQIAWIEEREQGPRRYHITPAPQFRQELVRDVRPRTGKKRPA